MCTFVPRTFANVSPITSRIGNVFCVSNAINTSFNASITAASHERGLNGYIIKMFYAFYPLFTNDKIWAASTVWVMLLLARKSYKKYKENMNCSFNLYTIPTGQKKETL